MGCLSGYLMSFAGIQKLFCRICSEFKCSFKEFVGEQVVSLFYTSAILGPPLLPSVSHGTEYFEEDGLPFWVPGVLHQCLEVVLWKMLSIQMIF